MKIIVFSDIHAVPEIWDVVYPHMQAHQPDGYWCLGDIIGRGYNPIGMAQTLKVVHEDQPDFHQRAWVKGNHDQNITQGTTHHFSGRATSTMMNGRDLRIDIKHRQQLEDGERHDLMEWIQQLPIYVYDHIPHVFAGIHIVHGRFVLNSDGTVDDYESVWKTCKTDYEIREQISHLTEYHHGQVPRLILNGHTHIPMIIVTDPVTGNLERKKVMEAQTIQLAPNQTVLVNVGSVSFPRDEDHDHPTQKEKLPKCALYATLDFHNQHELTVQFHTVRLPKGILKIPNDYDEKYGGELRGLCSHD